MKPTPKPPRKHDPKWKDTTRTARTNKRRAEIQAAAIRDGFRDGVVNGRFSSAGSQAITAWKNGDYVLRPQYK